MVWQASRNIRVYEVEEPSPAGSASLTVSDSLANVADHGNPGRDHTCMRAESLIMIEAFL